MIKFPVSQLVFLVNTPEGRCTLAHMIVRMLKIN